MALQWDSTSIAYTLQDVYKSLRRAELYSIHLEHDEPMKQLG